MRCSRVEKGIIMPERKLIYADTAVEQLSGLILLSDHEKDILNLYIDQCMAVPVVPGRKFDHDMSEACFRNGERNMKEKVISCLMEYKTHVNGACHAHVTEIIRTVEEL